jgi:hypothetical protein
MKAPSAGAWSTAGSGLSVWGVAAPPGRATPTQPQIFDSEMTTSTDYDQVLGVVYPYKEQQPYQVVRLLLNHKFSNQICVQENFDKRVLKKHR